MIKNKFHFFFQNDTRIVVALWATFQIIWYLSLGVHFDLESVKYIDEAQYILQHHHLSQFRYLFYFSTIAVIAFSYVTHIGLYGALSIIMLINLFSYLYFFKALKQLFPDRLSPYIVIGFLVSFWPYQGWSLYLFTECFFYSIVLVLFSHLILFRRLSFRFISTIFLILALLVISRPLGILFILPALLFIFLKLSKKQKLAFYAAAILFLVLLNFVVQIVFTTTPDWNMMRALTEDSIICDMPETSAGTALDLSQNPNQLYQLFYYITHNFPHFSGLALTRLKYFFTMVRDYFSTFHNLYLIGYLVMLYGSIIFGIKRIFKLLPAGLGLFIFSSILLFALTVALQCDDYHNRFLLALMPFFSTLSAMILLPLVYRFFSFLKPRKG
jgi:hypothetical protein